MNFMGACIFLAVVPGAFVVGAHFLSRALYFAVVLGKIFLLLQWSPGYACFCCRCAFFLLSLRVPVVFLLSCRGTGVHSLTSFLGSQNRQQKPIESNYSNKKHGFLV